MAIFDKESQKYQMSSSNEHEQISIANNCVSNFNRVNNLADQ